MAWAYCCRCDAALPEPTPGQVVRREYPCPKCGRANELRKTQGDLILELFEEIQRLKESKS